MSSGPRPITVGIDASRNRSGGAVAQLCGIMRTAAPERHGIGSVHLWAYDQLLDRVGSYPWLTRHPVRETREPIQRQLWWQYVMLPRLAQANQVDVMFNSDAGSVCPFPVSVTLSQDMLSFEPGEMERYPLRSGARWRLQVLKHVQLRRLERSTVALFLTRHARDVIGRHIKLPETVIAPHGIDDAFRAVATRRRSWPREGPVRCLYVSNVAPYKHQWHVVEAVARIRRTSAHDVRLRLVGGGTGPAMSRLLAVLAQVDPGRNFVELVDFMPHETIPDELAAADVFVFASSCENLPITLLEAMASGIVICSSNRGPMPEVLGQHANYFDPEDPQTIAVALKRVIEDAEYRHRTRDDSLASAANYTWESCADKTWGALAAAGRGLI